MSMSLLSLTVPEVVIWQLLVHPVMTNLSKLQPLHFSAVLPALVSFHHSSYPLWYLYIDGLVQERRNSIANTLELHLSCTNPLIWKPLTTIPVVCTEQIASDCHHSHILWSSLVWSHKDPHSLGLRQGTRYRAPSSTICQYLIWLEDWLDGDFHY